MSRIAKRFPHLRARSAVGRFAVVGLFLLSTYASTSSALQRERELFRVSTKMPRKAEAVELGVVRRRLVEMNLDLFPTSTGKQEAGDSVSSGRAIELNLFPDVSYAAILDRREEHLDGSASLTGHLESDTSARVILVRVGDAVVGSIRTSEELFQVRSVGDGVYAISEIDESQLPPEGEPLSPEPSEPTEPAPPPRKRSGFELGRTDVVEEDVATASDDGSQIDVAVFYTSAARAGAGGTNPIRALIQLGIAETNDAYRDSGIVHRVRLVHSSEISYVETGNSETDVKRLRAKKDGQMDQVHALRDQHGADIVHLIVETSGDCGRGYFMQSATNDFEASAFAMTMRTCVSPNYSFAHELGHNMGLDHDRYVANGNSPQPYCHGYVNQAGLVNGASSSRRWRTIMAYNSECTDNGLNCMRLMRFSNPNQFLGSDRMGILGSNPSSSEDGPADARRCLNETRFTVANFRATRTAPEQPVTQFPSGIVPERTPTFRWQPVSDASEYTLYVRVGDGSQYFRYYYSAVQVGCHNGVSGCVATPSTSLANGAYSWWVQARNDVGASPWSAGRQFAVGLEAPVLLAPTGTVDSFRPVYRFRPVVGATWYRLYVSGPAGNTINQWFSASAACSGATCDAYPKVLSESGAHRFWVQGWNAQIGYGPWSDPLEFSTPTGISKPSTQAEFYADASLMLAYSLAPGQSLGSPATDSREHRVHYYWALRQGAAALEQELVRKMLLLLDLKTGQGAAAVGDFYGNVCANWAHYGVDFGSPAANSVDYSMHANWARFQSKERLHSELTMRVQKMFASYASQR